MQKPSISATVGKGSAASLLKRSHPRRTIESASCGVCIFVNSSTSAPAMKFSFAERMTRPFGEAALISSRQAESWFSASLEKVLVDSPYLSKVSQASPSLSVSQ